MSAPRTKRYIAAVTLTFAVGGCAPGEQNLSMFESSGTAAQAVESHTWFLLIAGALVWVIVVIAMLWAVMRRKRQHGEAPQAAKFVLFAGAIAPSVIIAGVMAASVATLREIDPTDVGQGTAIRVTGHQFWWEVEYPSQGVVTANEIHIPTGERVALDLTTNDVIHSVWVPQLSGKIDMIPGRSNRMWLETDDPGVYWGQCAEYCGIQHARMRFVVVAHEPAEFEAWIEQQQQPARNPVPEDSELPEDGQPGEELTDDELVALGRQVFMSSSCVYCHAIGGSEANAVVGPDLTHLASRETLAAGVLPNTPEELARWIVDPQSIKPGSLMPGTDISGRDLEALVAYLASLE